MASPGPMDRYTRMMNTAANFFPTRPASCSKPPALATATTPSTGNPMAVMANPTMAIQVSVPACAPINGGKIRFPAPKNRQNKVSPRKKIFLFFIFSIIIFISPRCFKF